MACEATCWYQGTEYEVLASWMDDCNTCTCESGGIVSATNESCLASCDWNATTYEEGELVEACNTCTCLETGEVNNPRLYGELQWQETTYTEGQSWPDDCNTCTCLNDGTVSCTSESCDLDCEWEGATYLPGDSRTLEDGCSVCECADAGTVSCTLSIAQPCTVGG